MLDFHLITSILLIMLILFLIVMTKEVSNMRLSFKIILAILVILSFIYLAIFFYALETLVFETSLISHLKDGDLIEHLAKAF